MQFQHDPEEGTWLAEYELHERFNQPGGEMFAHWQNSNNNDCWVLAVLLMVAGIIGFVPTWLL